MSPLLLFRIPSLSACLQPSKCRATHSSLELNTSHMICVKCVYVNRESGEKSLDQHTVCQIHPARRSLYMNDELKYGVKQLCFNSLTETFESQAVCLTLK